MMSQKYDQPSLVVDVCMIYSLFSLFLFDFRPNLIDNHLALLLSAWFTSGLSEVGEQDKTSNKTERVNYQIITAFDRVMSLLHISLTCRYLQKNFLACHESKFHIHEIELHMILIIFPLKIGSHLCSVHHHAARCSQFSVAFSSAHVADS